MPTRGQPLYDEKGHLVHFHHSASPFFELAVDVYYCSTCEREFSRDELELEPPKQEE